MTTGQRSLLDSFLTARVRDGARSSGSAALEVLAKQEINMMIPTCACRLSGMDTFGWRARN